MKKARYICISGLEGVGKTTQTNKLVQYLKDQGYKVLQTKEPGTPLSPLSMELRGIMLDSKYESQITPLARELISQAIRSIHLEKVIVPALPEYDFIIQDRGLPCSFSYGMSCGHSLETLEMLTDTVMEYAGIKAGWRLYGDVIIMDGDSKKGLARAISSKQEFATGDAIEAKGDVFMSDVAKNMDYISQPFNAVRLKVDDKSIDEVFSELLAALHIEHRRSD